EYGTVPSSFSGQRYAWAQNGQSGPQTQAEWDNWYMWSEVLRRAARDHPANRCWQRAAQSTFSSHQFYGFPPEVDPEEAKRRAEEAAPSNRQIFAIVFAVAWIIAAVQIERLTSLGLQQAENNSKS